MNIFTKPVYYLEALGLAADFDVVTREDVTKAYRAVAANGEHPDNGGDSKRWTLVNSAFNQLKAIYSKKRGGYENKGDTAWKAEWDALAKPTPKAKPKAKRTAKPKTAKGPNKWGVEPRRADETADDYRRRYARETQAARYAADPDYAAKRKEASVRSHKKARDAAKAKAK